MADQKFVDTAKKVVVSRTVFAQHYDRLIAANVPDGLRFIALAVLRDLKAPGLTGRDKDHADFAEAFEAVNAAGLLRKFLGDHAAQLFGDQDTAESSLQSLTNFNEPFQGGLKVTLAGIDALRRACRITCRPPGGDEEKGSGFLIGPHLVLTNWHVVRSLLDAAGNPKEDSHLQMDLEFDYLTLSDGKLDKTAKYRPVAPTKSSGGPQTQRWLISHSEAHPNEIEGGVENEGWPPQPNELYDKLDFAIIELDGTPGHDRGHYDLTKNAWPEAGKNVRLAQFPLGLDMKLMPGTFEAPFDFAVDKPVDFRDNKKPPRIMHNVNTTKGSSGGLCIDLNSNAVALHQAGKKFRQDRDQNGNLVQTAIRNAAIPLPLIATVAGKKVMERIAAAPRVVRYGPKDVPIIGRRKFQQLVDDAIRGNLRVLAVRTSLDNATFEPRTKIGKTFSATILRTLLPASKSIVFPVESTRLTNDAYKAARAIVDAVNNSRSDKLPKPPDGQASFDAAAATALVDAVIDAMREAAGDNTLWLVIDDLDRNRIVSASTTTAFLEAFYTAIGNETKLRVVLIGLLEDLPTLATLPSDTLEDHITDSDIEDWISAEIGARLPLPRPAFQLFVEITRSVAEARSKELGRTAAVADVLRTHLGPNLRPRS